MSLVLGEREEGELMVAEQQDHLHETDSSVVVQAEAGQGGCVGLSFCYDVTKLTQETACRGDSPDAQEGAA